MKEFDLTFITGNIDRRCQARLDTCFPGFFAVQLMAGGSFTFQREHHPAVLATSPTFFWTERTSRYRYGPGETGSWDHHWLIFKGEFADRYYWPLLEALAPNGHVPVSDGELLRGAIRELIQSIGAGLDLSTKVHQLNRLLSLVERNRPRAPQPEMGLARIKQSIDEAPAMERDFPSLARQAGYSYSSFRRHFQVSFKQSPQRYLVNCRMRLAASLLTTTNDSIQQIGTRVGYGDPAHFSKLFKHHHGLSPRAYRQSALAHQISR